MRQLLFFFMLCLTTSLIVAYQDKGRPDFKKKDLLHFDHGSLWMNRKLSKFCSNNTVAQVYLTQILSVINTFQANSSYNSILNLQSTNFITYLTNTKNQELLRTDCEAFIKGFKEAKKADNAAEHARKHLAVTIEKQIKQVAHDVTNGKGFYELDD